MLKTFSSSKWNHPNIYYVVIECNHYKIQICPSLFSLKEKECEDNSLEETLLPTSKAMYASVRGQRGRQQMGLQRGVQSRIQQQNTVLQYGQFAALRRGSWVHFLRMME